MYSGDDRKRHRDDDYGGGGDKRFRRDGGGYGGDVRGGRRNWQGVDRRFDKRAHQPPQPRQGPRSKPKTKEDEIRGQVGEACSNDGDDVVIVKFST